MALQRIRTQEEIRRKARNNQIIIGAVMIALLVLATGGYSIMSSVESSNKIEDNGFEFYKEEKYGLWTTEISGEKIGMQMLPSAVEDVFIEGEYNLQTYIGEPLYIVGGNSGTADLINNLGSKVSRYQPACITASDCQGDLPVKECDSNVIIFNSSEETKVYKKDNCVFLAGDGIKATDKFLYKLFGII